jgi:peptidyl-prolyl cis-trans isomerase C
MKSPLTKEITRMNKKIVSLLLAGTTLLVACEQANQGGGTGTTAPAAPSSITKEQAAASVNGQFISKLDLENLQKEIARRNGGQNVPEKTLLDEMIKQELLIQEADKKNLQNSPEILARLEVIKRSLLSQAALQDYLDSHPITDEELKAEYDKKVAGENAVEYKARHILVKTEDEAKKLIEQLNKGAKFEDLAKKNSIEPGAKDSGGDLGWFTADQMVAPFSEAVVGLEKGKYTTAPVKTQFGWHVILREDSRNPSPPPFDAVKEQLRPMVQREKIQAYIEGLKKQAKIEILLPSEQPPAPPAEEAKPAEGQQPAPTEVPSVVNQAAPAPAAGETPRPANAPAPAAEETKPAEEAPATEKAADKK